MKKLLLLLCSFFFSSVLMAEDFTIDKTEVDLSVDEVVTVSFASAHYATVTTYSIYLKDEAIFLDFKKSAPDGYLAAYPIYSIPINLKPFVGIGSIDEPKEITINVRELSRVDAVLSSSQFKVKVRTNYSAGHQGNVVTDPTGTWYQPSLSGTGFVVMQYGNGTVAQYYGYDAEGGRLWLISEVMDGAWTTAKTKTLIMYEGKVDSSTGFTKPPANAPGIERWGTLELQFDSCTKAKAKLVGTDGEQSFDLERLATPMAAHCLENL